MPRVAAIDIGSHTLRVVELDGTAKKAKLVHHGIQQLPPAATDADPIDSAEAQAEAIAELLKEEGIAKSGLSYAVPVRDSVLRKLHVPFKGRDNVRKVLKAEMEGLVHSHAIDEMVADYQPLSEDEDGTHVLAAAVPKGPLKLRMDAAEKAGLEVEVLAHEAMGLYHAARWCGAFAAAGESVAPVGDDEEVVLADEDVPAGVPAVTGPEFRVVVQVAGDETVLLLVKDGELHDVRGLRAGDEGAVEEIATAYGLDSGTARWASLEALHTGADVAVDGLAAPLPAETGDPAPAGDEDEGTPAPVAVAESVTVAPALVQRAVDRYLASLRRELVRFLASVPELTRVHGLTVTGSALDWPGMHELLAEVFGVQPVEMDVLAKLSHSVPEEDEVQVRRNIPVAVGLGIGRMTGANLFQFRQEDLAFTKGFDRVKFPLALVCMLALFALLLQGMKQQKELQAIEQQIGSTYYYDLKSGSKRGQQGVQFTGHLNTLFPPNAGWFADDRNFPQDLYEQMVASLAEMDVNLRVNYVRSKLKGYLEDSQAEKSYYADLQMESGFAVVVRLTQLLKGLEGQLDRYRLSEIDLDLPSKSSRGGKLRFVIVVRGKDFRDQGQMVLQALQRDMTQPDSPFEAIDRDRSKEVPFSEGEGGAYLTYEVELRESFEPFPKTN